VFMQKNGNTLGEVLRFSDSVMDIGCTRDFLVWTFPSFLVSLSDAADTNLTSLDLRHLPSKVLATGPAISGLR
jgi:hypothetical protein